MFVTLDKLRQHLNILPGECEEDNDYLTHLIMAAENALAKRLNLKSLGDIMTSQGYLPEDVTHAVLLLCGTWYNARESYTSLSANKIPHTLDFLFDLNKNYRMRF